jgi:hypothetical protein
MIDDAALWGEYDDPEMPTIPIKHRAVRRDKTDRTIKRRFFQLTKYWTGGYKEMSYQNHRDGLLLDPIQDCKFYLEPHRMHKKYAYVSDIHGEEDWYRYKIYDRARWNRDYKSDEEDWDDRYFDNCLCDCCAYEWHHDREEYNEIYAENWFEYCYASVMT